MDSQAATVRSALRAGDGLDRLIAGLGTAAHPRGAVLRAYRNADRALRSALREQRRAQAVAEVLETLRGDLTGTVRETLLAAVALGQAQAQVQARAQGLPAAPVWYGANPTDTRAMEVAWLASVDAQVMTARALVAAGAGEPEIVGDDARAGVLRPAVVVAEGARWAAAALSAALAAYLLWTIDRERQPRSEWFHQAVAAIDERTTDCCLRVHGQAQPLEKPFRLTGTPRFADRLEHPPFHWYCRSSEALIHRDQVGDTFTGEMVDAAQAERAAREASGGQRVEIHPADARSRR